MLARDRTPSDAPQFRRPKLVIRQAPAVVPVDLAAWQDTKVLPASGSCERTRNLRSQQ